MCVRWYGGEAWCDDDERLCGLDATPLDIVTLLRTAERDDRHLPVMREDFMGVEGWQRGWFLTQRPVVECPRPSWPRPMAHTSSASNMATTSCGRLLAACRHHHVEV
jgi:hypothetical protein